ncbi:MAG: subclass B3 metallo-beta-lactamase [Terriglobia bacterium]
MNFSWNTIRRNRISGAKLSRALVAAALFAMFVFVLAGAQGFSQAPAQGGGGGRNNQKVKPFKIVGNIYFVGMTDQTVLLIKTPEGHILMDTTFERMMPWVRESLDELGVNLRDIKYILNSHAHADHVEGDAAMKELTGAKIVFSEADGKTLANPPARNGRPQWKAVQADRLVKTGDTLTLGGTTLTAHVFPGHTRGATTWTMQVQEDGRTYNVVFWGGVGGVRDPLVNNAEWPTIVEDYLDSVRRARALPCDIFTDTHGESFGLSEKMNRLLAGEKPNPFYAPQECKDGFDRREAAFREDLAKQQAAAGR